MQTEIKNLISFEFDGKTIKEYKQHIDDLKASMLQFNKETEEYIALADEAKKEQDKLNEVMADAKYGVDNLDGSYNALVSQMAELKRAWRETSDAAERADLGQKILDINNQLKVMDASIGNFQRNVGDYGQTFEEAFKSGLDITKGLGGNIGSMAGQVQKLIPLIKATSKAATTGLEGFKATLASTGIGGLVIIASTLLTKLTEFIKKQREAVDSTEAFKRAQEDAKTAVDQHNKELQYQITLMRSLGATNVETAKVELDSAQSLVDEKKEEIKQLKQELELTESFTLYKKKYKEQLIADKQAEIKANEEALKSLETNLKDRQVAYDAAVNAELLKINEAARKALQTKEESLKEQYESDVKFLKEHGATQEQLYQREQQYTNELRELRKAAVDKSVNNELKERQKLIDDVLKEIDEANKTEIQKLEEKYNTEYKLLEGNLKAQEDLTEIYAKKRAEILGKNSMSATNTQLGGLDNQANIDIFNAEYADSSGTEIEIEQQKADAIYEIQRSLLDKKIELLNAELENFQGTADQKEQIELQLADFMETQRQLDVKRDYEQTQSKKKNDELYAKAKKATYATIVSTTAALLNNLGQMEGDNAERSKGLQIAAATIQTIEGAVGAFMQGMANFPAPYGAIIGAAQAAVATAAGVAQISQIKAVDPTGKVTITPAPTQIQGVAASPLLNEENDIVGLTSLNVNGKSEQKETRVWISQDDLENSSEQVEIREKNTTF